MGASPSRAPSEADEWVTPHSGPAMNSLAPFRTRLQFSRAMPDMKARTETVSSSEVVDQGRGDAKQQGGGLGRGTEPDTSIPHCLAKGLDDLGYNGWSQLSRHQQGYILRAGQQAFVGKRRMFRDRIPVVTRAITSAEDDLVRVSLEARLWGIECEVAHLSALILSLEELRRDRAGECPTPEGFEEEDFADWWIAPARRRGIDLRREQRRRARLRLKTPTDRNDKASASAEHSHLPIGNVKSRPASGLEGAEPVGGQRIPVPRFPRKGGGLIPQSERHPLTSAIRPSSRRGVDAFGGQRTPVPKFPREGGGPIPQRRVPSLYVAAASRNSGRGRAAAPQARPTQGIARTHSTGTSRAPPSGRDAAGDGGGGGGGPGGGAYPQAPAAGSPNRVCPLCGGALGSGELTLIPGIGWAHAECVSSRPQRARQPPRLFAPSVRGKQHHELRGGETRVIAPHTVLSPYRAAQRPRIPPCPRRGGAVGQGRGADPDDADAPSPPVPGRPGDWTGRWITLDGGAIGLVVAAAIHPSGREVLLVAPQGQGYRAEIPWDDGRSIREVRGARRELVDAPPPRLAPDGHYRGVWRNGRNLDAITMVRNTRYRIARVTVGPAANATECGRAGRRVATTLAQMDMLFEAAQRPRVQFAGAARIPQRGREIDRRETAPHPRAASLGSRPPASQQGAARALFSAAPNAGQLAGLRAIATASGGLELHVVTFTASPFNASRGYIWGSAWVAHHGDIQLARGSSSSLSHNAAASLLAASQESLLGVHSFLTSAGILPSRVRLVLSIRRAQGRRGPGDVAEPSAAALAALYTALTGGVESFLSLIIRVEPPDAPVPTNWRRGLREDLVQDAAGAANGLRNDLTHGRDGQAVSADTLPGSRPFVMATEARPSFEAVPVPATSLHAATAVGTYSRTLSALLEHRTLMGISEGTLAYLTSYSSGDPGIQEAMRILVAVSAERESLQLLRRGRRITGDRPGDPVVSLFGEGAAGDTIQSRSIRATIADLARAIHLQDTSGVFGGTFAAQFSLGSVRVRGEGGSGEVSQLEGVALASAAGRPITFLKPGGDTLIEETFNPLPVPMALHGAVAALPRVPQPLTAPLVLYQRPLPGFTVLRTEAVEAAHADRQTVGAAETVGPGLSTDGVAFQRTPERLTGGGESDNRGGTGAGGNGAWFCAICNEATGRVPIPCCSGNICTACATAVVREEISAVGASRNGNFSGAQRRRRRHPFICPFCRARSRPADATGAAVTSLVSPRRALGEAGNVAPAAPLPPSPPPGPFDEAMVQYSPLYCGLLNYAASEGEGLPAALARSLAPLSQAHSDELTALFVEGRHLFEAHAPRALEAWRAVARGGYADAEHQIAARNALETTGGEDVRDFWLQFDILGPTAMPRPPRHIVTLDRGRGRGRGGGRGGGRGRGRGRERAEDHRAAAPPTAPPPAQPTRTEAVAPEPPMHTPEPPAPPPPPPDVGDAVLLAELTRPDHPMWLALRRLPIGKLLLRPPTIPKKHLGNRFIAEQLERAVKVATARCDGLDPDCDHDAHKLVSCIRWVILGKRRTGLAPCQARIPWVEIIKSRVDRLYRGDFASLLREAVAAAEGHMESASGRDARAEKARRAVEMAHLGKVSKALGSLASGGVLPLEEAPVREAFAALLQPHGRGPPPAWRDFVRTVGGAAGPESDDYKFVLGECEVRGANGGTETIDTLEHALRQCDATAAAGISGLGFDLLRGMSPSTVRPLLRVYFGQGRWDYSRFVDGEEGGSAYHSELHAFLVSVRGVALDKDGSGYAPGRAVRNLRPIGIGESLRRLAAQCQLLQLESQVAANLVRNGQYGAGFKNGADTVFHLVAKGLDAFVASKVAGGASQTDARNAFCSISRAAIQRGILRHAPSLLPAFDFLYGPNATGSCFFYGSGGSRPLGSCLLLDGVQQGDVFGPLFFSLGIDELLTAIRDYMRDLETDSTMVGQQVQVTGPTVGRLAGEGGLGSVVAVTNDLTLTLVAAPSYAEIEGLPSGRRGDLRVTVQVGAVSNPSSFLAEVPWEAVRLRAEVLLTAYLDDITGVLEAHLLRPFARALQIKGPLVDLFFDTPAKNYTYVPLCFLREVEALYPDAVIVEDSRPGSTPKAQLEHGAAQLAAQGGRGLLISVVGIAKLMGAPLRALCPGDGLERDKAWLAAQVADQSAGVARLFAHLGLAAVDSAAAAGPAGQSYTEYRAGAATLPSHETQIQLLIARYCLGTRLNCLSRYLPTSISQPALGLIDSLLVATVAGCAGAASPDELTQALQRRSLLAMRFGGVLPGAETPAPAQHVSSEAAIERFIAQLGSELADRGEEPAALRRIRDRIRDREPNSAAGSLSAWERGLLRDVELINDAHADPAVRQLLNSSSRGGDDRRRGAAGEGVAGEAEGGWEAGGENGGHQPLVTLGEEGITSKSSRAMSEGLWGRAFFAAYNPGTAVERIHMVEGLSKGAGLAFLSVPMVEPFTFTQAQFRRALTKYLGLPGEISPPWTHHCGERGIRVLNASTLNHLETCPMLGRSMAPHNAVRDALAHMVVQCGLTDAAVVETPVAATNGDSTVADVVYFDSASGNRVILEVSVVTVGSDSSLAASARGGLDGVTGLLRAREEAKRGHPTIRRILHDSGNTTIFTPIVMSASGAMGPAMVAFLKNVYDRAKAANLFSMAQQTAMRCTWNTQVASTYWDMRLSTACAITDADFQNRLIQRDRTLNLEVVARQPHPDPNSAPYRRRIRNCAQPGFRRS